MAAKSDAQKIAAILKNTDSEVRGDLLYEVADVLESLSQGFTASLIRDAARIYNHGKL